MKNKKVILIVLYCLLLMCIINNKQYNTMVNCKYFNQYIFNRNIHLSQEYNINNKPISVVVPHNETVMDMTASTLFSLSQYSYDTVIILSVNHQAKKSKILISSVDFITPFGVVNGDRNSKDIIKHSLGNSIIEDNEIVEEDHSASILMPYIKTYMPNTKVVTILFTSKANINEINHISEVLLELSKEKNILLIGSIDFSHYQSYKVTEECDNNTLQLIENFNIEELKLKNGKNLDSSESMAIILQYAKLKGTCRVNILEHRIVSNLPSSDDYGSYFSMYI